MRLRALCLLITLFTMPPVTAAGLEVHRLDGTVSSLGAELHRDRATLVMVWTTYCGVCREQYPIVSAFHDRHRAHRAGVLGIALDGPSAAAAVAAHRARYEHSFPSVLATAEALADGFTRATGEAFTGTPTYLLFDAAGSLTGYLSGPVSADALERALAR